MNLLKVSIFSVLKNVFINILTIGIEERIIIFGKDFLEWEKIIYTKDLRKEIILWQTNKEESLNIDLLCLKK